jgi:fucokinase
MQSSRSGAWDYLIVTAANERQAAAYELQMQTRRRIGPLRDVRNVLVVPDAEGRRVGSGGSTLHCLFEVLRRESGIEDISRDFAIAETILRRFRVLIVHAGGDSRRLPAYSPCGKIFVPLPGDRADGFIPTVFDRLLPAFVHLPEGSADTGQIVVASGDALLLFESGGIDLSKRGITALGARVAPETAARHGVFCVDASGVVRHFLQKPGVREQADIGAIGADGQSVLDIGVLSMDAWTATKLLECFGTAAAQSAIMSHGIDLYREIFCALGTDVTLAHYLSATRSSGSRLETSLLGEFFQALRHIPCHLQMLSRCDFLHFGSTGQLISSGARLFKLDCGMPPFRGVLAITNELGTSGQIAGTDCWVEGCRVYAPLTLRKRSVIVGVDVCEPLVLPEGACLDITPGFDRQDHPVWFIRYYGVNDTFKHAVGKDASFCGMTLSAWLQMIGAKTAEIWDDGIPENQRTLWNARVFPAEKEHQGYRQWSWMLDVESATPQQKRRFLSVDRYSSAEVAVRVNQSAYHARRAAIAGKLGS